MPKSDASNSQAIRRDAQMAYLLAIDRLLDAARKAEVERERFFRLVRAEEQPHKEEASR